MSSQAARPSFPAVPQRWSHVIRALDPRVLGPALLLTFVGLLALWSDRPTVVFSQLKWLVVGLTVCVGTVIIPYRRLLQLIYPFYALVLLSLVLVIAGLGRESHHATRWLQIGPIGFQPSELAKVAVIAVLAKYIRFRRDHKTVRGLVVPFLLMLVPLALIVKQPDLGTALMLVPVLFVMLWAAGAQTQHLLAVVVLGLASLPLLWTLALKPYQKGRVKAFTAPFVEVLHETGEGLGILDPPVTEADQKTESRAETLLKEERGRESRDRRFHVERSMIAVAAGGVFGMGFRNGVMNGTDAVPESWTDFVFTVYAEEWGFVGVVVLVGLEGLLLLGLALTANEVREPAAKLLAVGALTLLGTQACVNLAMTVGLAPVTGLPLPFLSYGGSSMLSSWLILGMALNARAHKPLVFAERAFD